MLKTKESHYIGVFFSVHLLVNTAVTPTQMLVICFWQHTRKVLPGLVIIVIEYDDGHY